jgi:molecular chaperone DnaK
MAADNKSLGRFMLDGIPPAPRGVPQIEVTFDIDANGILNVSAKDKGTGKEQSIRIEASSGLTDEEIERMKKDAEEHAEEDKKKREMIDVKNTADTMIYTTEKMMKDVEEKKIAITDEEKKAVEDALAKMKEVKDGDDAEAIKTASEALSKAGQAVGMKMYQQEQSKTTESAQGGSANGGEDGAVEGEVVDESTEEEPKA